MKLYSYIFSLKSYFRVMYIKKLSFLPWVLLITQLQTACSDSGLTHPAIAESTTEMVNQEQSDEPQNLIFRNVIFSVKTQITPASISLNLNIGTKGFKTKSKTIANDLKSLKFCLLESTTGVSPAGGVNLSPLSEMFSYNITANPATITFTNISANNTGKSYYIGVAAYDEFNGTGNNITNNSGNNADNNRVTLSGTAGNFYVSGGGGDTSGTNAGSLRVTPVTYTVSSTDSLTVQLKLLD
jgi:hypothetical protein